MCMAGSSEIFGICLVFGINLAINFVAGFRGDFGNGSPGEESLRLSFFVRIFVV